MRPGLVRGAALTVARELGGSARVVTVLCDRAERYFSTRLFAAEAVLTESRQSVWRVR